MAEARIFIHPLLIMQVADHQARQSYGKAARRRSLMYDQRLTLKALTQVIGA